MLGRETKILLALLGTLSSGFVGVLGSKLFVSRPPHGAGPDVHLPAHDHEDGPIVEPPSFDRLGRSMFSATDAVQTGADPAVEPPDVTPDTSTAASEPLLEPPTFWQPDESLAETEDGVAGAEVSEPGSRFGVADSAALAATDRATGVAEPDLGSREASGGVVEFPDDAVTDPAALPLAAEAAAGFGGVSSDEMFGAEPLPVAPERFTPPPDAMPIPSGSHLVTAGDTWWSVAERAYGDGRLYKLLFAWNRAIDPRVSLAVGTQLEVPPLEALTTAHAGLLPKDVAGGAPPSDVLGGVVQTSATAPLGDAAGGQTVVVRPGDTLISIAREQLGSSSQWRALYEANRETLGRSPGPLTPGTQLVLP